MLLLAGNHVVEFCYRTKFQTIERAPIRHALMFALLGLWFMTFGCAGYLYVSPNRDSFWTPIWSLAALVYTDLICVSLGFSSNFFIGSYLLAGFFLSETYHNRCSWRTF